jgi:hypothetical protein
MKNSPRRRAATSSPRLQDVLANPHKELSVTTLRGDLADLLTSTGEELDQLAADRAPAVVRLAKLRRPVAVIGVTSAILDVEAAQERDAYEVGHDAARTVCEVLRDAVGPQLARSHSIDSITQLLEYDRPGSNLARAGVDLDRAAAQHIADRVADCLARVVDMLSCVARDETVLPDLRAAALDAVEVLQHAGDHYVEA